MSSSDPEPARHRHNQQRVNQFGQRYALLFKPALQRQRPRRLLTPRSWAWASHRRHVIDGGGVNATPSGSAATHPELWRSVENLTDSPSSGTVKWAVSQASPMRRVHVTGNMVLDDNGGWSSGGSLSDSQINGQVNSGSQQQWLSRNSSWGSWTGSNWNMVFVGDTNAPSNSFPARRTQRWRDATIAEAVPLCRSPAPTRCSCRRSAPTSATWAAAARGTPADQPVLHRKPADTAATINTALSSGRTYCSRRGLPPQRHDQRHRADTVVLGPAWRRWRRTAA
jgi:hypothetical protein